MTGPSTDPAWDAGVRGVFSRTFRFGEWISEPVTPLFESWLLTTMEERLHEIHLAEFGMRAPHPRHVVVNGWYFYSLAFLPVTGAALRRSLPTLVARLARNPRRASLWIGPFARFGAPAFEREWREELAPAYEAAVLEADAALDHAGPDELVAMIDRLAGLAGEAFASITVVSGSAYKTEMELARFYGRHLGRLGGSHLALVTGLTPPAPPPPHAVSTLDWCRPTRGELAIRTPSTPATSRDHDDLVRRREAAETAARRELAGSVRRLRTFERLLADAQRYARTREEQAPQFTLPWPVLRRAVQRLGGMLVTAGVIDDADDAFFLRRDELVVAVGRPDAPGLAHAVVARRQDWKRAASLEPPLILGRPPMLVRKLVLEGRTLVGGRPPDHRTLLAGVPASPGRATGRVRIIRDPAEGPLAPGEILVAPMTAPAWTWLFDGASAVITDVGSALAHASIIAREYGIPAVVGCGDATRRLRDGQLVVVDGDAGLVEAADDAGPA